MRILWRSIPGTDGWYEASDTGLIRSWRYRSGHRTDKRAEIPNLLSQSSTGNGYLKVTVCVGGHEWTKLVHRLVAAAFLGKCPPNLQVRHDNGIRTDNRASNLLYGTGIENQADRLRHGTAARGQDHANSKLNEEQVRQILAEPMTPGVALARRFCVTTTTICDIRHGRSWAWLSEF